MQISSRPRYDVPCPTCKVEPQAHCRSTTTNRVTDTHNARLRLEGEYHAQKVEYERHCANSLRQGMCPDSGLRLHANGNAAAVSDLSCDVCDCFGYSRAEIDAAKTT